MIWSYGVHQASPRLLNQSTCKHHSRQTHRCGWALWRWGGILQGVQVRSSRRDEPRLNEGNTTVSDSPQKGEYETTGVEVAPVGTQQWAVVDLLNPVLEGTPRSGSFMLTKCLLECKLHYACVHTVKTITIVQHIIKAFSMQWWSNYFHPQKTRYTYEVLYR